VHLVVVKAVQADLVDNQVSKVASLVASQDNAVEDVLLR
jgi:hypothetical protein